MPKPNDGLVMLAGPHDRVDFTRWLAEVPVGILQAAVALLETGSPETPLVCTDDPDLVDLDGKTADELFTQAVRNPAEAAWARKNWRECLERMRRP